MFNKEISEVEKEQLDAIWSETVIGREVNEKIQEMCQEYWEAGYSMANNSAQAKFDKFIFDLKGKISDLEFNLDPNKMRAENIWDLIDELSSKQEKIE
jgi:hypothetical protein